MTNWTDKQKDAIDLPANLLVSAAAGSGKTAVLTERIVRHVKKGTDIESMLVVTFTRAAAAEMKKRIAKRLLELAEDAAEAADKKRFREQAQKAEHANISTVHSFCSRVLRRHFHAAKLDPSFKTADDTQKAMLMAEAIEELLEERYENGPPEFLELLELLDREDKLISLIFDLYGFMESQPDPHSYISEAARYFESDAEALSKSEPLLWLVENSKAKLRDVAEMFADACCQDVPIKQKAQLDDEYMRVRGLLVAADFDEYRRGLIGMDFAALRWNGSEVDEDVKKEIAKARQDLKDAVKEQAGLFRRSPADEAGLLKDLLPAVNELRLLIYDFDGLYEKKKRDAGVIDYSDMEHKTLEVFGDKEIAQEYRDKFEYIFIDEYQDTNGVQESIINAIERENNVFMVGDVKQSIYRFRLAEPGIFTKTYEKYKNSENGNKVDLNSNFRSAKGVIDIVNLVFRKIMSKGTCGIEYDEDAELVMGRKADGDPAPAELHILEKAESVFENECPEEANGNDDPAPLLSPEEEEKRELTDAEREALLAAERISDLMGETGPTLTDPSDGKERHYRYSDFAVLLRDNKTAQVWAEVLGQQGIPAYAQPSGGYFDAAEVKTVMNLLRVIDNRRQDIPLTGVLLSKVGGFTPEELAGIRVASPTSSVYESLLLHSSSETELGKKAKEFIGKLEGWRYDAQLYGVGQLVETLLEETGYYDFTGALAGGARRQANLDAFLERARDYERNAKRGLWSFIRFMDAAKKSESMGEAQIAASDVVNILTVHRSKGLEFPVVLLAGLGKGFNCGSHPPFADKEWGFGLEFIKDSVKRRTLNLTAIRKRAYEADIAEEMRVLYVGMTRARDRLIMIGTTENLEKFMEDKTGLTPYSILSAKHSLDWILKALCIGPGKDALSKIVPGSMGTRCTELLQVFRHPPVTGPIAAAALTPQDLEELAEEAKASDISFFEERFAFKYPYNDAVRVPGKTSVSSLSHSDVVITEKPAFALGAAMTAADRGTATHLLMQRIAILSHTKETVGAELERLQKAGFMTREQANAVNINSVTGFFGSPLGKRLAASPRVEREWEFNHAKPACELLPDTDSAEPVLLQGIIDCAFSEDNAWVLIDYKTDFVPEGVTPEQAAAKHSVQISLYRKALSDLTGLPVKEAYIHLLSIGESVRME